MIWYIIVTSIWQLYVVSGKIMESRLVSHVMFQMIYLISYDCSKYGIIAQLVITSICQLYVDSGKIMESRLVSHVMFLMIYLISYDCSKYGIIAQLLPNLCSITDVI